MNKFVIITYARTRSNLLVSLLDQHPDIDCKPEIFYNGYLTESQINNHFSLSGDKEKTPLAINDLIELRNNNPIEYMDLICSLLAKEKQVAGFKLFPGQNNQVLQHVLNDKNIKKIILIRNFLFSYVSYKQAIQTNEWILEKGQTGVQSKINFQMMPFLEYLNDRINELKEIINHLERTGQKYFLCFSEDIGKDDWWRDIYNFLGISNVVVTESLYEKQNPSFLEERVSNFREMVRQLMNTSYSRLLYGDFFPDRQRCIMDFMVEDEKPEKYLHEQSLILYRQNKQLSKELKKMKSESVALEKQLSVLTNSQSFRIGYMLTRLPAIIISNFKINK